MLYTQAIVDQRSQRPLHRLVEIGTVVLLSLAG
jgi:hypothetical protein